MTTIRIRENPNQPDGCNATLSFDDQGEYPIAVSDPFSAEEEALLEWYFEQHMRFPFTDQVRAQEAAASVATYGERLFEQVFANRRAFAKYQAALQAGVGRLAFEVAGKLDFHRLHWEALKDPELPRAFALDAPMVRKNLTPQIVEAPVRPAPTINLLVVTARPLGERDVAYRTISRPLVEGLRQANLPVRIDILRPGTYRALVGHLEATRDTHGAGYYHVIHFDLHGALLTHADLLKGVENNRFAFQARFARPDIAPYAGLEAFLFLEGEQDGPADPVRAGEMADLLIAHQIPIAILNACQSGKQIGASETSLGSRLMQAGAQMVLAMGYSITVTAAELLMRTLYAQLFANAGLSAAIRRARLELCNTKGRRVYFDQVIDLEDWLLPVVYQHQEARLAPRPFTPEEAHAFYEHQAARYQPQEPTYGFVGRDLDILQVERRLLRETGGTPRNLLLVRGMGGAGKTTLLRHLGAWWQTTHFVEQVCYFGYDERAWTRQQIMDAIARQLLTPGEYAGTFQPLGLDAQQAMLAARLRATRHLLILDNLESITGAQLAIQHTLPPEEQAALRRLLADLRGGKTLVLLGSRGGEEWLAPGTFGENVYELPGLDPEAATALADRILERHGVKKYREDARFPTLMRLLAGYPLALEVVLANLARQTPAEVLAALQAGDIKLDSQGGIQDKTTSIMRCIDYSHSNLSPEAQGLLACLAPFTGVLFEPMLEQYSAHLREQPALAHLSFERWAEVLREARDWGLVSPITDVPVQGFLRLQPIFPYFLRSRMDGPEQEEARRAVETAFRQLYDQWGGQIRGLLRSKEAQQKQVGQVAAHLEYENLMTALNLALEAQGSILNPYVALSGYLDTTQDQRRGLELGESILVRLEKYPADTLAGPMGAEFASVIDDIAQRQLLLKQYAKAESSYQKALRIISQQQALDIATREKVRASILHQLGMVAQEQREWAQAQHYYQQALQIYIKYNDRYEQAGTYHQLGRVAQEQREWAQAQHYYQQVLQICIEYNDRYHQALPYHQLGRVAQEQREWAQAQAYYQQALQIKIEYNDRYSQASIYHNLGMVAQEQREWAQAQHYYQQALQIKIEYNDRYSQARTYHHLGIVAQAQREWAQAQAYYQQALQIYVEYNDRYNQAKTYHQLGMVAQAQREWTQSQAYYQQALQIFVEYNDRHSQAKVLHVLGSVAQEQRQFEQARDYYQQALQLYIEFNDRLWQAGAYHQLGNVAVEQREWAQAQTYYQQALQIYVEINNRYEQAGTYHQLGRVAQAQQQWAQAQAYYQQALQIKIEYNDRYSQARTYHHLGMVTEEQREWAQAQTYYQQALQIYIEYNDRSSQAGSYHQLGRVAEKQQQWAQARDYFLKDLAITAESNDRQGLGITLRSLARLWRASGDATLPAAVAAILGFTPEEVEEGMRSVLED